MAIHFGWDLEMVAVKVCSLKLELREGDQVGPVRQWQREPEREDWKEN